MSTNGAILIGMVFEGMWAMLKRIFDEYESVVIEIDEVS